MTEAMFQLGLVLYIPHHLLLLHMVRLIYGCFFARNSIYRLFLVIEFPSKVNSLIFIMNSGKSETGGLNLLWRGAQTYSMVHFIN